MAGAAEVAVGRRLIFWLIYVVLASVVPLGWTYSHLAETHAPHSFAAVLSRGELVIISTVLATGSVGDLLARKTKGSGISIFEGIIIGSAVLLLMCGGWLYSLVSSASPEGSQSAVLFSLGTFVASCIFGASSIVVDYQWRHMHDTEAG
jgi:hypothetical protein